jgi:hypothetical protein
MEPYEGRMRYRGVEMAIRYDEEGDQMSLEAFGEEIGLGTGNAQFLQDAKALVDCRLDAIAYVRGARLERFDNAGHRDARLSLRGRILAVWIGRETDGELIDAAERLAGSPENR